MIKVMGGEQGKDFEEFKSFIEFGFTEAGCKTKLLSDSSLRILKDATKVIYFDTTARRVDI